LINTIKWSSLLHSIVSTILILFKYDIHLEKQALIELNKNKTPLTERELISFTEAFRTAEQNIINIIIENLRLFSPGALVYEDKDNLSIKAHRMTRTSYEQIAKLLKIELN
jgi:hypothetical protein